MAAIFWFQSSFELTGYITIIAKDEKASELMFQSSFELTGYITMLHIKDWMRTLVSKLFRAYGLYNKKRIQKK